MSAQKRIALVVKAKNLRKGDRIAIGLHDGDVVTQGWGTVEDTDSHGYGSDRVAVRFGDDWDNQDTLDPDDRVVVLR